jgi:hypothetical protein
MARESSNQLIKEINSALKNLMCGSIEIYVQDNVVTQITVKNIKKTRVSTREETDTLENGKNEQKVLTNKKHKYINVYTKVD